VKGWRKTPNGREPNDPRMQQIVFQIQAGRPYKDIAEQFGISIPRVCRIRLKAGLPKRPRPVKTLAASA
jgi:hypothetical protein